MSPTSEILSSKEKAVSASKELKPIYDAYYSYILDFLKSKNAYHRNISFPLFIEPFPEYFDSKVKLMIIGKETFSWPASVNLPVLRDGILNPNIVELVLRNYSYFELGKGKHSPFWQFCRKLNRKFNKSDKSFIWNNISKVDENKTTPKWDILKGLSANDSFPIIKREIAILKPRVIVFLTGSIPDSHLYNVFKGLKLVVLNDVIFRMVHSSLPYHSYKTQHPKSLRVRGTFDRVIEYIYADVSKEDSLEQPLI